MKVNFLITCYDHEAYIPYLLEIIKNYKTVEPIIVIGYTGIDPNFKCDFRIPNPGHQAGDRQLTIGCYDLIKDNGISRILKLGADSWILNEQSIINIFQQLEEIQVPYGGNFWHHNLPGSLATDIIFADTRFGNVFEEIKNKFHTDFEISMWDAIHRIGKSFSTIQERYPTHWENRFSCEKLGWTMEHSLAANIAFAERYK